MKRLRSIAFSIAFPLWTGICCIVLAFGPLLPRKGARMALAAAGPDVVATLELAPPAVTVLEPL